MILQITDLRSGRICRTRPFRRHCVADRPFPRPPARGQPHGRPPVTILRPACGIENYVEETLASAFALDYPEYEILFCVADERDPVIPLIQRLMDEHPDVPARLLVGDDRISINPKLNNLVKGWNAAAHDWIVMTDSQRADAAGLSRPGAGALAAGHRAGLLAAGRHPARRLGADLECAFLNTYQARWQLIADALGTAYAQGKTMFWRRDYLDEGGSIEALAAEPAEDAASTKLIRAAGRKVRLVIHPSRSRSAGGPSATSGAARCAGRACAARPSRWSMRRRPSPAASSRSRRRRLAAMGALPIGWFIGLAVAWYGAEALLARRYDWPVSPRILGLMIVRDLLLFPLWVVGWTGNKFVWRGNAMDIKDEGTPLRRLVERWSTSRVVRSAMALATGRRRLANMERGNGAPPGG